MINRYGLERACGGADVIKRKTLGLQYRVDMDYKTRRRRCTTGIREFISQRQDRKKTNQTKHRMLMDAKSVHASTDLPGQKA